jgi:hypothetical protein
MINVWDTSRSCSRPARDTHLASSDADDRGQNVTFAKRYDANIVQPALAALEAAVDAIEGLAVGLFDWDGTPNDIMTTSLTPTDTSHDASVTVREGRIGKLLITFGGESACWGANPYRRREAHELTADNANRTALFTPTPEPIYHRLWPRRLAPEVIR